jgi:hypothetical protein
MSNQNTVEVVGDKAIIEARPVGAALACEEPRPSDEMIAGWKSKYGDVHELKSESEDLPLTLYFRKPSRQHLSRFTKSLMQDSLKALQNLVADTLLYPEMDKLTPLFAEKPGLIVPIGTQLQEIAGTNTNFFQKKL